MFIWENPKTTPASFPFSVQHPRVLLCSRPLWPAAEILASKSIKEQSQVGVLFLHCSCIDFFFVYKCMP